MAEVDWNEINVDENIDEKEVEESENISIKTPVGKFICKIIETKLVEKSFSSYSCYAVNLKMKIESILEIEKPLIDEAGKPIKKNGEILKKIQPVEGEERENFENLHSGKLIFDDINLYNEDEKPAMKKRRLFVLKKCNVIAGTTTKITKKMLSEDLINQRVIVTTENNSWKDKNTGELKTSTKVTWDGYEYVSTIENNSEDFEI